MARIISEGFESGDSLFWSAILGSNTNSNVRSGLRCWQVGSPSDLKILPASYTEFYFRWAERANFAAAAQTIVSFQSSTATVITVILNADNTLSVFSNNGANLLFTTPTFFVAATYYLFEIHVKIGNAGVAVTELKIDGISRGSNIVAANNQNGSSIDRISFISGGGRIYLIDDLAFNDTTTGSDNSWPGDGHFQAGPPVGAGFYTQWSPSAGSNWQNVDEVPSNGDTDYNTATGSGVRDSYAIGSTGLSGVNISRVYLEERSKIDVADGSTEGMFIRRSGTNYDDSLQAQTLSYAPYKTVEWLTDPATGLPWTIAGIEATEIGIRI